MCRIELYSFLLNKVTESSKYNGTDRNKKENSINERCSRSNSRMYQNKKQQLYVHIIFTNSSVNSLISLFLSKQKEECKMQIKLAFCEIKVAICIYLKRYVAIGCVLRDNVISLSNNYLVSRLSSSVY